MRSTPLPLQLAPFPVCLSTTPPHLSVSVKDGQRCISPAVSAFKIAHTICSNLGFFRKSPHCKHLLALHHSFLVRSAPPACLPWHVVGGC
ncbi:hypothetical protein B0J15DRAFT_192168 [Fusarium solani]|uniref:Uncharacterized protein n=1 Tax=Fusarium solani TaxID=169388 RepID=A0A9P9L2V1_FUSSL|nr:uncharacterized protein B0J15DRAFT_192168 [Fusarium solani]KAH7272930.1 hypothetical protein B0J15DRAFT_192168 [Fusarium solani]